ncbi:IS701 family transposase [Streptomyces sp. NPDC051561]|uniref:IS701 family transposase n=1 Tax=Streptomyces sp. NPDC051561 TaxID=3365658 RepID=UPI0037894999
MNITAGQLSGFADTLFGHLSRADQRRWGQAYLQGLLSAPGKKTVRGLAAAITDSPTASQSLQQFINSSPWAWEPTRHQLARWTTERLEPQAWTVSTVLLPKRGNHSCGVHRRFAPRLGQNLNCQVGIGLFLSARNVAIPVDWRLYLPEHWAHPRLRQRARIPEDVQPLPSWILGFNMADGLRRHTSLAPAPLVADLHDSKETGGLGHMLSRYRHDFVIALSDSFPVLPCTSTNPAQLPTLGASAPIGAWQSLAQSGTLHSHTGSVVIGSGGVPRRTRILSTLVCLLPVAGHGPHIPRTYRLFAEWRPGRKGPARVWITNMVRRRTEELLSLVDLQTGTADTMSELEQDFGLLDFEGRSYPGWHHHMTLVSAAHAFRHLA